MQFVPTVVLLATGLGAHNSSAIETDHRLTTFFCPELGYSSYCCEAGAATKLECQGVANTVARISSANVFINDGDTCYMCRCVASDTTTGQTFYLIGKGFSTLVEDANTNACTDTFFPSFHTLSSPAESQSFPQGFSAAKVKVTATDHHVTKLGQLKDKLKQVKDNELIVQITSEMYDGRTETTSYFRFKQDPKIKQDDLASYMISQGFPIVVSEVRVIDRNTFEGVFASLELSDHDNLNTVVQISCIDFTADNSASEKLGAALKALSGNTPSQISPSAKVFQTMVALDATTFPTEAANVKQYVAQLEETARAEKHIITAIIDPGRIPDHIVVSVSVYAEVIDTSRGRINGKTVRERLNEIAQTKDAFSQVHKFEIQFTDKCFAKNDAYPWNPKAFVKQDVNLKFFSRTLEDHYSLYYVLRREREKFSPFYYEDEGHQTHVSYSFDSVIVNDNVVSVTMLMPDNHIWKYLLENKNGEKFLGNLQKKLPGQRSPALVDVIYHEFLGDAGDRSVNGITITDSKFDRYVRYDKGEECGEKANKAKVIWGDLKVNTFSIMGEKTQYDPSQ